jgi:hypothetical protein
MNILSGLRSRAEQLAMSEVSAHFTLRFLLRNPPLGTAGEGYGKMGVRGPYLVSCYAAALERLFEILIAPPFSWEKPNTRGGKTDVFVLHIGDAGLPNEPFTAMYEDKVPYICLPCRSAEPVLQNALHRAEMEAVHEATHVFCWSLRPPVRLIEEKWGWFNEATAVFMESFVFAGNPDSIRFGLEWTDAPHVPLDDPSVQYQAGFFARYIARRFGPQLIGRLWAESKSNETPLQALERLLPAKDQSKMPSCCKVFGDYAHDSFFVMDHTSLGCWNEVYLRFGSRALTEAFVLGRDQTVTRSGRLDHLACRYYRIQVSPDVTTLEVVVGVHEANFRAFVAVHSATLNRCSLSRELEPSAESGTATRTHLRAVLGKGELTPPDAIVLTVANCGTRSAEYVLPDQPHDDDRPFTIEIRVS